MSAEVRPEAILLATHNAGKLREMRQITEGWPVRWLGLDEFPELGDVEETGTTFAGNARLKALEYAQATGMFTIADDSGLEVDALDGAPGVYSARYAGTPKDDAANNRKLVAALRGVPETQRTARFRCVMALAHDGDVLIETTGSYEGVIVDEPRGTDGFGYDPHFFVPDLGKTVAELSPEVKNARSHRGQAMRAMLEQIKIRWPELQR